MRWIYFAIGVFATVWTFLVWFLAEPQRRPSMLRVCITAAVVNYLIFAIMSWAKKRGDRWAKNQAHKANR